MSCSNRFPLPGSPSTCALDTAIAPLPSILLLAGPLILVPFFHNNCSSGKYPSMAPSRWLHIPYTILVSLTLGMTVLEIARLVAEHAGIGLLPVVSVALSLIIVALVCQTHKRTLLVSATLFVFWTLSIVVESVKVSRLHLLNVLHPDKGSKYPSSDKLLDNAVILGLYVSFFCIEGATLYMLFKGRPFPRSNV